MLFRYLPRSLGATIGSLSIHGEIGLSFCLALAFWICEVGKINFKVSGSGAQVPHDARARCWVVSRVEARNMRCQESLHIVQIVGTGVNKIRSE